MLLLNHGKKTKTNKRKPQDNPVYDKRNREAELRWLFSFVSPSSMNKLKRKYGISSRVKDNGKAFIKLYENNLIVNEQEYDDFYSQLLIDISDINEKDAAENGKEKIRNVLSRYDKKTLNKFINGEFDLVNILLIDYFDRTITHISSIDNYCEEVAKKLDRYR